MCILTVVGAKSLRYSYRQKTYPTDSLKHYFERMF
uniref:Uncharacterized protein n=1 Tax=Siphoviridae sp. ctk5O4 TaxID=2827921 RepID=A0A8S5SJK2_9CAUD|nr:MAG TPA: hypothetical protein [Siphoviridae sp. ctk5O4]